MTKQDICKEIQSRCDAEVTQTVVGEVIDNLFDIIGETLVEEDKIAFLGFGTFKTSFVKGRTGKNPLDPDGEDIKIPDSYRIFFSAGKGLKEKVATKLESKKVSKKKPSTDSKNTKKKVVKKKKK